MTQTWQDQARALVIGSKRKVACCSTDRSAIISNGDRGVSLYCFRCQRQEFEPHGERSIAEIMATRRAADALAERDIPSMPADAVPLTEGPKEAWRWVLRGGLTPEQANDHWGMRWHEKTRRVLIPIHQSDRLVGLLGRAVFGERPKYRMLGGPADTLFNAPHRPGEALVVVEDILSAIAVWRAGANATAVLGTSITPVQAAQIAERADRVIGWFDGDAAGDRAWQKLRNRMAMHPVTLDRIRTEQDPKELHRSELRSRLTQNTGA